MNKLEQFGSIYMAEVRDRSIFLLENLMQGKIKAPRFRSLQDELIMLNDKDAELVKHLVVALIDNTLHNTLFLLEEHPEYELINNDDNINDLSDGLSGELYTEDGWIEKYSKYPSSFD